VDLSLCRLTRGSIIGLEGESDVVIDGFVSVGGTIWICGCCGFGRGSSSREMRSNSAEVSRELEKYGLIVKIFYRLGCLRDMVSKAMPINRIMNGSLRMVTAGVILGNKGLSMW
jgi:hypothetical protein